ncbi:MAG: 1-acyl-sn-glycerol-3-phosphate acyltransferase [Alphaproteobacteria bacterium]|nr:1-acyl-sn-glycerol-3-phosphate acyltransferase [Alphaproteobacteria bacterium]
MTLIRSALFQIWFWAMSAVLNILFLPALALPKAITFWGAERWAALTLWGLRAFADIRYEVRGLENIPKGPVLIASKHQCMWDTVVMHALLKNPALILKQELLSIPFYGWYARKMAMIAIDRSAQMKALRAMIAEAKAALAEGRPIVIFPEGTRVPVGETGEYKPGVAAVYTMLGIPCVPVALNSGLYWPRRGYRWNPGTIVIEFLKPIDPGLKREAFMTALESHIETATARLVAEGQKVGAPALAVREG